MNTKTKNYFCWLPTCIYILYIAYMQYVINGGFWLKGALLSFFATLLYLACFIQLKKSREKISKIIVLISSVTLSCSLLFLALYVGKDAETALISGTAVHTIIAFIFAAAVAGKKSAVLQDKDTGAYYRIKSGKAYRLSDSEVVKYCSASKSSNTPIGEFSSSSIKGFDSNSPVIPMTNGLNLSDYNSAIIVNPSSGMPMVGGISGLDIHGNSFGTNFNEPSSTYDPNRGY